MEGMPRHTKSCASTLGRRQGQEHHTERAMMSVRGEDYSNGTQQHSFLVGNIPCNTVSELIRQKKANQYKVSHRLLLGSEISEPIRAKMRAWVYEETARRGINRKTCCLAVTYIDFFLNRGGVVAQSEISSLGLACLLLANKMDKSLTIPVDASVFPMEQVLSLEEDLCRRMNYRLNPVTYVDLLEELLGNWNQFAVNSSDLWAYSHVSCSSQIGHLTQFSCRKFYELADILFMVVKTLRFDPVDVVVQILKRLLERDYESVRHTPRAIEDEVIINFWDNPEEAPLIDQPFQHIYRLFSQRLKRLHISYDFGHNQVVHSMISSVLFQGFEESHSQQEETFNDNLLQTFNRESWPYAKALISGPSNRRKASSDTTD